MWQESFHFGFGWLGMCNKRIETRRLLLRGSVCSPTLKRSQFPLTEGPFWRKKCFQVKKKNISFNVSNDVQFSNFLWHIWKQQKMKHKFACQFKIAPWNDVFTLIKYSSKIQLFLICKFLRLPMIFNFQTAYDTYETNKRIP